MSGAPVEGSVEGQFDDLGQDPYDPLKTPMDTQYNTKVLHQSKTGVTSVEGQFDDLGQDPYDPLKTPMDTQYKTKVLHQSKMTLLVTWPCPMRWQKKRIAYLTMKETMEVLIHHKGNGDQQTSPVQLIDKKSYWIVQTSLTFLRCPPFPTYTQQVTLHTMLTVSPRETQQMSPWQPTPTVPSIRGCLRGGAVLSPSGRGWGLLLNEGSWIRHLLQHCSVNIIPKDLRRRILHLWPLAVRALSSKLRTSLSTPDTEEQMTDCPS